MVWDKTSFSYLVYDSLLAEQLTETHLPYSPKHLLSSSCMFQYEQLPEDRKEK